MQGLRPKHDHDSPTMKPIPPLKMPMNVFTQLWIMTHRPRCLRGMVSAMIALQGGPLMAAPVLPSTRLTASST